MCLEGASFSLLLLIFPGLRCHWQVRPRHRMLGVFLSFPFLCLLNLSSLYVSACFVYMYVCVPLVCPEHMEVPEALDPMELEMVMSQCGCSLNSCPLEKQSVLLTAAESSFQNILPFLCLTMCSIFLFSRLIIFYTLLCKMFDYA